MSLLPVPNCDVGRKCMELFNKYSGDELQLKLAEYTSDEWIDLYEPLVFKMVLPNIAQRYERLRNDKERERFNAQNPEWQTGKEMSKYLEEKKNGKRTNEAHQQFLEDALRTLEKAGDARRTEPVRKMLTAHKAHASRV